MSTTYMRTATLAIASLMLVATPSFADNDRHGGRHDKGSSSYRGPAVRGQVVVAHPVPQVYAPRYVRPVYAPRYVRPAVVRVVPYRPYYYTYRPGFSFSFAYGYPTTYSPYPYPAPPTAYLSALHGQPYGGVRIPDAPQDGQVFADG